MADNSIALKALTPVFETPVEAQTKVAQLRALQNAEQVNALDLQGKQNALADDASARAAIQIDPTGGQGYLAAMAGSGNYKGFAAGQKAGLEAKETKAKTSHAEAQAQETKLKALNESFKMYRDQATTIQTQEDAAAWVRGVFSDSEIGPLVAHNGTLEAALKRIPPTGTPEFAEWKAASMENANDHVKRTTVSAEAAAGNTTSRLNNRDTNKTSRDNNRDTIAGEDKRAKARLDFDKDAPKGQVVQTDEGTVLVNPRDGSAQPVTIGGKQLQKPLKDIPASVNTAIVSNSQNLSKAETALALLQGKTVKDAIGDKDATGWKGYLPNGLLARWDPDGVDTRAFIADLGSMVLHERSGAAVTAAESPRLMPFIPLATDNKTTAEKKLKRFVEIFRQEQDATGEIYSKEQGYKPNPVIARKAKPTTATTPTTNAKGWALHKDAQGNSAYVSPDGKQYEEVK